MRANRDYPAADERSLVKWAQQGDTGAFEELVARHRDKIYARALAIMRNEDDALDLSQEAWIKCWQRLKQFQGESSFATWMTRLTINVCLDGLRQRKRQTAESIEEMAEESGGVERYLPIEVGNPTAGLEREDLRRQIQKAFKQLTDAHRTVLILHEFDGLQYKQIAKVMKCSVGTVMSRLFYARRRMASLMTRWKREQEEQR